VLWSCQHCGPSPSRPTHLNVPREELLANEAGHRLQHLVQVQLLGQLEPPQRALHPLIAADSGERGKGAFCVKRGRRRTKEEEVQRECNGRRCCDGSTAGPQSGVRGALSSHRRKGHGHLHESATCYYLSVLRSSSLIPPSHIKASQALSRRGQSNLRAERAAGMTSLALLHKQRMRMQPAPHHPLVCQLSEPCHVLCIEWALAFVAAQVQACPKKCREGGHQGERMKAAGAGVEQRHVSNAPLAGNTPSGVSQQE